MPKPYNYAKLYKRSAARTLVRPDDRPARTLVRPDDRQVVSTEQATPEQATPECGQETVRIPAGLSFEEYCLAVGTDPAEARRASVLSSLAAYLADDPIGRASGVPSAARRK